MPAGCSGLAPSNYLRRLSAPVSEQDALDAALDAYVEVEDDSERSALDAALDSTFGPAGTEDREAAPRPTPRPRPRTTTRPDLDALLAAGLLTDEEYAARVGI